MTISRPKGDWTAGSGRVVVGLALTGFLLSFVPTTQIVSAETTASGNTQSDQAYQRGKQLLEAGYYQEAAEAFREAAEGLRVAESTQLSQAIGVPAGTLPAFPVRNTAAHPEVVTLQQPSEEKQFYRLLEMAETHLADRRFEAALAGTERALELRPKDKAARRLRSRVHDEQKAFVRLEEKKSRQIQKARELELKGEYKKSLSAWQKAQRLDPDDHQIQDAMQRVQERLDARHPKLIGATELTASYAQRPLVKEYHVSIGDVIEVFVWQQPDLARQVIVRPDGRISFPLVGDIDAAGRALTEIDTLLTEGLKTYLRFPDVSLAIRRFGGTKTIVLGEVQRRGIFVPTGQGRVLDALAMAGGFKVDAVPESVILIRGGLANPQVAKLNLAKALGGVIEENVRLQPNDIIYVPKKKVQSTLDFMERFFPTISQFLVGQSIAENFGVHEVSAQQAQ